MASVDWVVRMLECPVCMELHRGKAIYTCTNGHNLCQICYEKPIATCPLCRISFKTSPPARNRLAEALQVEQVPFPCANCPLGCVFRDVEAGLVAHEASCNANNILAWTGKVKFRREQDIDVQAFAYSKAVNGLLEVSLSHWPDNVFMWFTGKGSIDTVGRPHATLRLDAAVPDMPIISAMRRSLSVVDGTNLGIVVVNLEEVVLVDFLVSGNTFRLFPFGGGEPLVHTVRTRLLQHLHQDLHNEIPHLDQEQLAQVVRQHVRQRQLEQEQERVQRQESQEPPAAQDQEPEGDPQERVEQPRDQQSGVEDKPSGSDAASEPVQGPAFEHEKDATCQKSGEGADDDENDDEDHKKEGPRSKQLKLSIILKGGMYRVK